MKRNDIKAGEVYQYHRGKYGRSYKALVIDTEPVHRKARNGYGYSYTSDKADGLRVVFLPAHEGIESWAITPTIPVSVREGERTYDGEDAEGRQIYRVRPNDLKQSWADYEAEVARRKRAVDQAKAESEIRRAEMLERLDALPSDLRTFFDVNDHGSITAVVYGVTGAKGLLEAIERNLASPPDSPPAGPETERDGAGRSGTHQPETRTVEPDSDIQRDSVGR